MYHLIIEYYNIGVKQIKGKNKPKKRRNIALLLSQLINIYCLHLAKIDL